MKKFLSILLVLFVLFTSCSTTRTFYKVEQDENKNMKITTQVVEASPYGLLNQVDKTEGIAYRVHIPSIIFSIVFAQTIVVPVVLTGFFLFQPYKIVDESILNK
jgi:hypothetical protein